MTARGRNVLLGRLCGVPMRDDGAMTSTATTSAAPQDHPAWFAEDAEHALTELHSDPANGLTAAEAASRLQKYGRNEIAAEPPPSIWAIVLLQLRDPMSLMLIAVSIVSFFIDQIPVGVLVACLVILNVVLGTRQELLARASVDALAKMQISQAKVVRDGTLSQIPATELVPGDLVNVEAGDLVPADGRLIRSATLETQEASLTGESAPIAKDPATLDSPDVALGDRINMVFQNTSVTRGTASFVVTETGMRTQMGQIASMLSAVPPTKSPLQREMNQLTKVLGAIAWSAVVVIVVLGLVRGQSVSEVMLLGISMAVSAADRLSDLVRRRCWPTAPRQWPRRRRRQEPERVEILASVSGIIRTRPARATVLNQMIVRQLYARATCVKAHRRGLRQAGADPARRRACEAPSFTGSRTGSAWTATPRCPTTAWWSATRPRRRWSCWPPRSGWMPR